LKDEECWENCGKYFAEAIKLVWWSSLDDERNFAASKPVGVG
jgi:hypothetical protein